MTAAKSDLVLENQEDVRNVQSLKVRLAPLLGKARRKKVRLDAAAVERVDASALQLLTTFALALQAQKRELEWHAPSPAFVRAVHGLGLGGPLGLDAGVAR
jgi:anti-anti-sigma regulatory factor